MGLSHRFVVTDESIVERRMDRAMTDISEMVEKKPVAALIAASDVEVSKPLDVLSRGMIASAFESGIPTVATEMFNGPKMLS